MIESRMRVDKKKFGKFIASRREIVQGIETQELLAKRLNVSVGYMGKLESGGGLPSFELFIDLADALQMTPGELMMVLAEREDTSGPFQEMNAWLFDRISTTLAEYARLMQPSPDFAQPGAVTPVPPRVPLQLPSKDPAHNPALARADEAWRKSHPKKPPLETDVPEPQETN